MIVRVVVPATTERVLIIIMPENEHLDEAEEQEEITIYRDSGGKQSLVSPFPTTGRAGGELSQGDAPLVRHARWRAQHDADAVKDLTRKGKFVRIDDSRLERRIGNLVLTYFDTLIATDSAPFPGSPEHKTKHERYKGVYLKCFHEALYQEPEKITYLSTTPVEARLRDLAIQDHHRYPSPWRRPFHQRDLAVVRVLLELDISLDCAEQELEHIHDHADIYEDYYAHGMRNEIHILLKRLCRAVQRSRLFWAEGRNTSAI